MTTILYVKGDGLYTDSRHVKQIDKMYFASDENKIRVSKDKTFAWAITGDYTMVDLDKIEMLIRKFLTDNTNQIDTTGITYNHNGKVRKLFNGSAIIVTATGYGFVDIEGDVATNLAELDYISVGTGSPFASAVMQLYNEMNPTRVPKLQRLTMEVLVDVAINHNLSALPDKGDNIIELRDIKPVAPYTEIREGYLRRKAKRTEEMLMVETVNKVDTSTKSYKPSKPPKCSKPKENKEVSK